MVKYFIFLKGGKNMKKIKTFTKCLFGAFLLGCFAFAGCDFSDDSSDSGGSGNSTGGATRLPAVQRKRQQL